MDGPSSPAISGNVAKTIGTAPRSPTHEIKSFVLFITLNGARVAKTLKGRAMNIRNAEIRTPIPIQDYLARENKQAECHKEYYLHQPGQAIEHFHYRLLVQKILVTKVNRRT